MDTLYVVPPNMIYQFWHLAEPHLQKAINISDGEYNIDQLKVIVSQGISTLLVVVDENKKCKCALTVEWLNYANARICYINYIGGETKQNTWQQFIEWVKSNGGTAIQGCTSSKAIVRLWRIKWKMKPKYTLMELKL